VAERQRRLVEAVRPEHAASRRSRPRRSQRPAPSNDQEDAWRSSSTFDNGATYTEMRLLARAYAATKDEKYKQSFERGLKFIFDSQYPNGGWPQRFPLQNNYGRHITFNDKLMSSVMALLKEVSAGRGDFGFVPEAERKHAKEAFDRGVECVLKMQIKNPQGELTGWCQQHDEVTLAPASARAYELPSIASFETADMVFTLMQIERPEEHVRHAITSAVKWLEKSQIHGKRYELIRDKSFKYGVDRKLSDDPNAPPLWARFYEIETNRPMFSDRDGAKRYELSEVGEERRAKYAWYGTFGEKVLAEYPKWQKRVGGEREIRSLWSAGAPERAGGFADFGLENGVHVGLRAEAGALGDDFELERGFGEELDGSVDAQANDLAVDRPPYHLSKTSFEHAARQGDFFDDVVDVDPLTAVIA
jgi:PelA/Pel-15E family pectate lyase